MRVVIFHRFNRVFQVDDRHRMAKLSSANWWENRIKVYRKTAYRSLQNQSNKDFEVWAVFNKGQMEHFRHIKEFADEISDYCKVVIEDNNPTVEYEPLQAALGQETLLFNLDSDDHLHKDTVELLHQHKDCFMADGYVYDLNTERLHHYHANGAPPPFWGVYIPKCETLSEAYQHMKHNNGHHYQKRGERLPDGMYLYSIHSDNTTNAWDNKNTAKHVGKPADKKVLKDFGYE